MVSGVPTLVRRENHQSVVANLQLVQLAKNTAHVCIETVDQGRIGQLTILVPVMICQAAILPSMHGLIREAGELRVGIRLSIDLWLIIERGMGRKKGDQE